ncbi:rCG28751 [Rattus norvegicus]|uniref:RCG28751 n=1 Tax=Rattus norvegicus TaxID=10116 RepID=A6HWS1_RAT|nr:rCG28751 [Rattus norvegicus]
MGRCTFSPVFTLHFVVCSRSESLCHLVTKQRTIKTRTSLGPRASSPEEQKQRNLHISQMTFW